MHAAEPAVRLYSPAAHAAHGPPSAPVYPALQRHGCALPASDCACGGQAEHAEATEAPAAAENVPAGQSVHAEAPAAAENVPAGQSVHGEPPSEYAPARQFAQSAKASDVAGEDLPAGQAVHTAAPVTDLYFPAAHFAHSSWSCPVNPGLHTQLARPTEPLADCEHPVPPQVQQAAQSG